MSCRAVSCRVVPCRAVSCRVVPCRAVSCRAVPCRAVPCRAVPCRAVPCRAVPCRAVPCRAVSCRVVPCRAVSCRVVMDVDLPSAPKGHRIPAQSEALGTRYPLVSRSEGTPQVSPCDHQRLPHSEPARIPQNWSRLGTVMARRSWAFRARRLSRAVMRSRRSFETSPNRISRASMTDSRA